MPPVCIRCRRESEDRRPDALEVRLEGPDMLAALRAVPRDELDERQRAMLDRIAAGLCPSCGRAL